MQTSARNQFPGRVSRVERGPITTEVTVALAGGEQITAALTTRSADDMKLVAGREVGALVKASSIVIVVDAADYILSARNQLAGTVSRVEKGAVSSIVGITLAGGSVVTASVTNDSVAALGLAAGKSATAVFKAFSVLLAVKKS
jgi:molybdate transport system regulatory protein